MIEILVGLGIMQIIDWLFPDLKNDRDSTIFLIDMDGDDSEPVEQWEDWGDM